MVVGLLSCVGRATEKAEPLTEEAILSKIPNDTVRIINAPEEVINEIQSFEKIIVLHLSSTFEGVYNVFGKYHGFYYYKSISDYFKGNVGENQITVVDYSDEYGEIVDTYDVTFVNEGISALNFIKRETKKGVIKFQEATVFEYKDGFVTTYGNLSRTMPYIEYGESSVNIEDGHRTFKLAEFIRSNKGQIDKSIFKEVLLGETRNIPVSEVEFKYDYYTSKLSPSSYFVKVTGSPELAGVNLYVQSVLMEVKDNKIVNVWSLNKAIKEEEEKLTDYYEVFGLRTIQVKHYQPINFDTPKLLEHVSSYEIDINSRNEIASVTRFSGGAVWRRQEFKYFYKSNRPIGYELYEVDFDDNGKQISRNISSRWSLDF